MFSLLPIVAGADNPTFEIPTASWEPIFYESINALTKEVHWTPLRETKLETNEIVVRIWIGFGLSPLQCFSLQHNGTNWSGFHAQEKYDGQPLLLSPLTNTISWSSLWDQLVALGILTLPDSSSLPDKQLVLDGVSYVVEIRRHDFYRTYEYGNPKSQHWPEAKKIIKIVEILYSNFIPVKTNVNTEPAPTDLPSEY